MEYRLIERPTQELTLNNDEYPIIANSNGTGYYRVAYAPSLLAKLSAIAPKLSEEDRFTLVTDCWSTVELGQADVSSLLKLIANLKGDRSVIVCSAIWNVFSTIDRLEPERDRPGFRTFARSVLRPAFDAVGWIPQKGESEDTVRLRSDLIWYLCELGDQEIQSEGCEQFENFLRSPATVDPNLRLAVFCCVGAAGSDAQYQKLKELAMKSNNPSKSKTLSQDLPQPPIQSARTRFLPGPWKGIFRHPMLSTSPICSAQLSLNPEDRLVFLEESSRGDPANHAIIRAFQVCGLHRAESFGS